MTIARSEALLAEVRTTVATDRRLALATARSAWRGIPMSERAAFLRGLFVLMRDTRIESGVAFSLRELRKIEALSFGEARRLFLALDRTGRSALIDRYIGLLHARLPHTGLPLRKALNQIWATRRPQAMLDYLRAHAPRRLADREMIGFYAAQFVKFKDAAHAAPLFAHLVELTPADSSLRLALARGLLAARDYVGAARHGAIVRDAGERSADAAILIDDVLAALHDAIVADPAAAMVEAARDALAALQPIDGDHPQVRAIARILSIVGAQEPARMRLSSTGPRQALDSLAEAIALMSQFEPRTRPYRLATEAAEDLLRTIDIAADVDSLDRLLTLSPGLAAIVADRFIASLYPAPGVAVFRALTPSHAAPVWQAAIRLAAAVDARADLALFAERLAATPDAQVNDLRDAARAFDPAASALHDRFWTVAVAENRNDRIVPTALRALYPLDTTAAFYPIAIGVSSGTLRRTIDPVAYVEALRSVLARGWRRSDAQALIATAEDAPGPHLPPDLALWTRAIFAWANFDHGRARALLDEGHDRWPDSDAIAFDAERVLLETRFGRYGAAAAAIAEMTRPLPTDGAYAPLAKTIAVVEAVPPAADVLYPQYLIDALFDRPVTPRYDPVPASLVTICAALSSGGSERQAVSVIEALSRDPRVSVQSLLVRGVTPVRRAFFLPQVEASGIPFHVFEDDPVDVPRVLALLGEPPASPLAVALRLLPVDIRNTICQLVPLLVERRPAVVHIRQDFFVAALACVLAGVPRCFIHRGSLSPDHWDLTEPQRIATIAPMRHVYRRLVEWPGFAFINNAMSGVRSDQTWTGCAAPQRFSLIHNIVDFDRLGPSDGPEQTIRRSIGAGPGDLVVGAAFRFHRVKRPLLWLAVARHILTRCPDAHFLILGEGELREVMTRYAAAEGFADRLHLPGSLSDIGPWYRAMDFALLTSDREGLPNMLIEAQHFGVPVVSTDVGGAAETMHVGRTGILLPVDASAAALGDALVTAFEDRDWYGTARAAAPEYVHEHFGARATIDQIVALYGFDKPG